MPSWWDPLEGIAVRESNANIKVVANTVAEYWRDISSAFQNFTVWGAVRFLLFRVILLHPLMSLLLLILIAVTVRHLIERGWLRNQGQWVGGGQG